MHVGTEVLSNGKIRFRVWAPAAKRVELVLVDETGQVLNSESLEQEADGYYTLTSSNATAGSRYFFRLNQQDKLIGDPASRFQPDGPHGPSEVIDPRSFPWNDHDWPGVALTG